ncbi:MAG: L,D-transpeptidase Cds6 family protein [Pseudomonadales bacterium]
MTRGLVFNSSPFRSQDSSTNEVLKAHWLMQVLPDFGIVQLTGSRADTIQVEFERTLDNKVLYWRSSEQFSSFAELLADTLNISTMDHAYLQHSLRKWAESDEVLWLVVDGEALSNELLMQIKEYAPLSKKGQFAIRILLKISDERLHSRIFKPLLNVIHERVGGPNLSHPSFLHASTGSSKRLRQQSLLSRYKIPVLWFISVTTIAAGILLATQNKPVFEQKVAAEKVPVTEEVELWEAHKPAGIKELVSQNEVLQLSAFIRRWSTAWQAQSIDEYFSMYAQGYSAYSYMLPDEWRLWRQERLKQPTWISIEIGPVELVRVSKDEFRASFWQLYRSDGYQDDTLKVLSLKEEGGVLKIIGETNQEVRLLSKE